ncbi:MAG: glycogen/starch/alpha-glucan phosphorylase [Myxococcales bacterium]|nr:glycogen/starch/alpha-glucan phosphorylase [Myxococcales bacterium]
MLERRLSVAAQPSDVRTDLSASALRRDVVDNLFYTQAKFPFVATRNDYYLSLALAVRDRLLHRWVNTAATYLERESRTVIYMSAEFLLGPHLHNNLINLGIEDRVRQAVSDLGLDLDDLIEQEEEPGLGNGGLGRLAACYMDSLATLEIPAIGYGIRYEFGIFDQEICDGWQVEVTDKWLRLGNPWEIARPEISFDVKLGGHTEAYTDADGRYRVRWHPDRVIKGIPYDTPILGYRVNSANFLRLWKAEAIESFDFNAFNVGDYYGAVDQKVVSENLTKVLYPNDEPAAGKELRLAQQYFFVSCSLQDMIRLYKQKIDSLDRFADKFVVQLNDTHPAIGVAELMRLLVDVHEMPWERAWDITRSTFAYTNHTLLPEALEKWPLELFRRLLPRHLEIIFEINARFLEQARAAPAVDDDALGRLSIIDESGSRYVRMANLACVGSRAINGVAALHTELLKQDVLHDFYQLWPEKFSNKTNGVTPRRFMLSSNPRLSQLISEHIGEQWPSDLAQLTRLAPLAEDADFQRDWREVKRANKVDLARRVVERTGIEIDPDSMFDILVKRIHEYKRQHLKVLHIIALYLRIKRNPNATITPRTFIFGGKAAPGYFMAKRIIKLINSVGDVVNNDREVAGRLKVVFFPDFNVTNAQPIYPAADLSEQISTAGKEASGTGNMKFSLNGALTIGTLDGANVEIREHVGADNFFVFGLTVDEVKRAKREGYDPRDIYQRDHTLRAVIDAISDGTFSAGDRGLFEPIVGELLAHDQYMLLADFGAYLACQDEVAAVYRQPREWTRRSILNVARMGFFSSDRAIKQYCEEIWNVEPVSIQLDVSSATR